MPQRKPAKKRPLEPYHHQEAKRTNNPPAALAERKKEHPHHKTYAYDPHLDPRLDWAGKQERSAFQVETRALHVHERIEPAAIMKAVRKKNGEAPKQLEMFAENNLSPEKQLEFYQHDLQWSNRLIAGDSLLIMNSLLEKEGMSGQVQMVYMDPPYGIKYGSNFQPNINKRDVKDGKDSDLATDAETICAFRDTWELGIHSYLSYMRDRLYLARELLKNSGSCFVQISDENVHLVRLVMDEVFGTKNFISMIYYATTSSLGTSTLSKIGDYILWYAKDKEQLKSRNLFIEKDNQKTGDATYRFLKLPEGDTRPMTAQERRGAEPIPAGSRIHTLGSMTSQSGGEKGQFPIEFEGNTYRINRGSWKTNAAGVKNLKLAERLGVTGSTLWFVRYVDDFPVRSISNMWGDTGASFAGKDYIVQTVTKVIQRCMLMTTDPGDLVLDPTCGSGTTAFVAEQWGRRWISCDTSRVSLAIARKRLMTATFDYYKLQYEDKGVSNGFNYKTCPHITLGGIARDPEIKEIGEKWKDKLEELLASLNRALDENWQDWQVPREGQLDWPRETIDTHAAYWHARLARQKEIDDCIARNAAIETLYDQPLIDKSKARITGPFTYEAVPSPVIEPMEETAPEPAADNSLARTGETIRQAEWREELLKSGIWGKGGARIEFASVESLPCPALHVMAETKEDPPRRAAISLGPHHAPLGQAQVRDAIDDAKGLAHPPDLLIFTAFQFDPEAGRAIDTANGKHGFTLLKAAMNPDLNTEDLQKARRSNQSFWLVGGPDIAVGKEGEQYRVSLQGFDYYNPATGEVESGGTDKVAIWMLDTNYDGHSLYPQQIFFPGAKTKEGWDKLARVLQAEIDAELIEAYRGVESLPFAAGEHRRVAVKIIDNLGYESMVVEDLDA